MGHACQEHETIKTTNTTKKIEKQKEKQEKKLCITTATKTLEVIYDGAENDENVA